MQRSKNETLALLTKALTAAWRESGANPGTQAEFAEALFLLETYGFNSVELLEELAAATTASAPSAPLQDGAEISDLAHAGPALFDFATAEAMPLTLHLVGKANPLVLAGLAATYGGQIASITTFYLQGLNEVIAPADYVLERENLDNIAGASLPLQVVIEPGFSEGEPLVTAEGPVEIDEDRWQKLTAMAG